MNTRPTAVSSRKISLKFTDKVYRDHPTNLAPSHFLKIKKEVINKLGQPQIRIIFSILLKVRYTSKITGSTIAHLYTSNSGKTKEEITNTRTNQKAKAVARQYHNTWLVRLAFSQTATKESVVQKCSMPLFHSNLNRSKCRSVRFFLVPGRTIISSFRSRRQVVRLFIHNFADNNCGNVIEDGERRQYRDVDVGRRYVAERSAKGQYRVSRTVPGQEWD